MITTPPQSTLVPAGYSAPPSIMQYSIPAGRFPSGFSVGPDQWGFNLLPEPFGSILGTRFPQPRPLGGIDWEAITGRKKDWGMAFERPFVDPTTGLTGRLSVMCITGEPTMGKIARLQQQLDETHARPINAAEYDAKTGDYTMNNFARHGLRNTAAALGAWDENGIGQSPIKFTYADDLATETGYPISALPMTEYASPPASFAPPPGASVRTPTGTELSVTPRSLPSYNWGDSKVATPRQSPSEWTPDLVRNAASAGLPGSTRVNDTYIRGNTGYGSQSQYPGMMADGSTSAAGLGTLPNPTSVFAAA